MTCPFVSRALAATIALTLALFQSPESTSQMIWRSPYLAATDWTVASMFFTLWLSSWIRSIWRGCAAETGITLADGVLPALAGYDWPGNLRQLTGMLRTLIALAGPNGFIGMQDLPPVIRSRPKLAPIANALPALPAISLAPISATLAGITEQAIRAAIEASNGNVAAAARKLGVSRSTLYRHMT